MQIWDRGFAALICVGVFFFVCGDVGSFVMNDRYLWLWFYVSISSGGRWERDGS